MSRSCERTVRLHNRSSAQVSLSLHKLIAKSQPKLRRGVNYTPVLIPAGAVYDVCRGLQVDFEQALQICAESEDLHAHERALRIQRRVFPPDEAQQRIDAEAEAGRLDAEAKTAALTPPDPVDALPAGAALCREIDEMPVAAVAARSPFAPREAPLPSLEPVAEPAEVLEEEEEEEAPRPAPEGGLIDKPSTDWSISRLKRHAADLGVDIRGAKGKNALLRRIRAAGGTP